MKSLKGLSDRELLGRLNRLVQREHKLTLDILAHLVEVERRGLYLAKGYGSLYVYCKGEFGYSDASAWRRANATRAIRRCPEAFALLEQRRINMCALGKIHKAVTPALPDEICDKSQADVALILASHDPRKAIRDQMRLTAIYRQKTDSQNGRRSDTYGGGVGTPPTGDRLRGEVSSENPKPSLRGEPSLGYAESRLHSEVPSANTGGSRSAQALEFVRVWDVRFAGDKELKELVEWMKAYLSGRCPDGVGLLEVFKYAMNYVREREDPTQRNKQRKLRKEKQATKTTSKRASSNPPKTERSRHIPIETQDQVWTRDNGRCAFVGANGKRCDSTHNLQFDHFPAPFARGGASTPHNLRLLCSKHNRHSAEKIFGEQHMAEYVRKRE